MGKVESLNDVLRKYFRDDRDPRDRREDPTEAALRDHITNMSAKERLKWLRERRLITDLQMRTVAHHMDRGWRLEDALEALEKGELPTISTTGHDPQLKRNVPKLADAPKDDSKKQKLLWLKNQGSISVLQMRNAAELLNRNVPLERALAEVGASHVLDVLPEPEQPKEAPLTIEQLLKKRIPELKEYVAGMEKPAMVLQLLTAEIHGGENREGARRALIRRALELGATDDEIEAAVIARELGDTADDGQQGDATDRALEDMREGEGGELDLDDEEEER